MRSARSAAALLVAVALVLGACATDGMPDPQDPRPLVVDLDMDSSDVMALAYAAGLPGYDLVAVTVPRTGVARCPQGADNARLLLVELGAGDVPVGCGREAAMAGGHDFPDAWRDPADALYGVRLAGDGTAATAATTGRDAVTVLRDALRDAGERVDLLTLGPLTNVAWALQVEPDLADRIGRVVMMAGAVEAPGNVEAPAAGSPEWNAWADPGALAAVLRSGVEVVLVPLDATDDVPLDGRFWAQLSGGHAAAAADVTYELLARNAFLLDANQFFWDPLVATFLENPDVVEVEEMRLRVGVEGAELGRTIADGGGREVRVATAGVFDEFLATFLAGLRRGIGRAAPFAPGGPLTVDYDGTRCNVAVTAPISSGPLRVAFTNASSGASAMAIVTLHDGVPWEELEEFVAGYAPGTANPDFVDIVAPPFAAPGTEAIVDLAPGTTGVACYDHLDGVPQRIVLGDPFEVLP